MKPKFIKLYNVAKLLKKHYSRLIDDEALRRYVSKYIELNFIVDLLDFFEKIENKYMPLRAGGSIMDNEDNFSYFAIFYQNEKLDFHEFVKEARKIHKDIYIYSEANWTYNPVTEEVVVENLICTKNIIFSI